MSALKILSKADLIFTETYVRLAWEGGRASDHVDPPSENKSLLIINRGTSEPLIRSAEH